MPVSDKERRSYLKKVEKCLVCSRRDKKRILKDLNENIDDVLMDKPKIDIKRLEWEIGDPEEIAQRVLETSFYCDISNKISVIRIIINFFIIAIIIIVTFIVILKTNARVQPTTEYYTEVLYDQNGEFQGYHSEIRIVTEDT